MPGYQYAVVIQDVYVVVHCLLVVQAAVGDGRGIWNRPLRRHHRNVMGRCRNSHRPGTQRLTAAPEIQGRLHFCSAEERFNRATELDDHRISAAILRGGDFNTHPTLGHVVFVNIGFLDTIKANTHVAAKHLFAIEGATRIDGEVIRWNVCVLVLGHDGLR